MSSSVSIKKYALTVKGLGQKISKAADNAVFRAAQLGIQIIEDRTDEGRGVNKAFPAYSEKYLKWKKRIGKHRSSAVNLELTNDMRSAMIPERGKGFALIGFSRKGGKISPARKAMIHHKLGAGKTRVKRPFFAFNANEKKRLTKFIGKRLGL